MALLLAATILVIHRSPPIRRADRKVIGIGFDLIAIARGATQAPIAVQTFSLKGLKWRPRECRRLRAPPTTAGQLSLARSAKPLDVRPGGIYGPILPLFRVRASQEGHPATLDCGLWPLSLWH